jgi:hypothetical protein
MREAISFKCEGLFHSNAEGYFIEMREGVFHSNEEGFILFK